MAGVDAFGTTLSRGGGELTTEIFTPIANLSSVSGPGISRETLDVTAHDSPGRYMEFVGSAIDGGEVSADLNWDPSLPTTALLLADLEIPTPVNYQIAFPDGKKFSAALLITGFEPSAPYDDKLTASLTFKVTGKPTFV